MRVVSAGQLADILDYPSLIAALDTAFAADYVIPPRHHHEISESATHLLMPAWSAGTPHKDAYLGTKLVNIFSQNATMGLPSIAGLYVLQSGLTGAPLCVIDGAKLTAKRTAAVSALAEPIPYSYSSSPALKSSLRPLADDYRTGLAGGARCPALTCLSS